MNFPVRESKIVMSSSSSASCTDAVMTAVLVFLLRFGLFRLYLLATGRRVLHKSMESWKDFPVDKGKQVTFIKHHC